MPDPGAFEETLKTWFEVLMRSSMRGFAMFAKESGLSMTQINTLVHLRHKGPSGVTDIGDELGVSSAAASQMLDRLVQLGLILRTEGLHDRRLKQIALTPEGETFLHNGLDARQKWIAQLAVAMTPAEKEQVVAAIQLMIDKMLLLNSEPKDVRRCPHHTH